ncbi:DUF29 domain-containing protein [Neisseria iguanae]|uniref:DUF29 domain-containing protein n=1 Tax=Neisseria iguanae TaxID=90242 RepID=A0A2P7TWV5_9NEIS|nr:DUF29 domain-containing protein [Neisseria iguanae]PSJ79191.1 DUF29 domain-containing protein [Neisseria iguanae]
MATSYETDFAKWAVEQANLLRAGVLDKIDLSNLAEEIESMGKSEHRELKSRMMVLVQHLLKWKFQPAYRGISWRRTIAEQRVQIALVLQDSPSLSNDMANLEWITAVWDKAVKLAAGETGISKKVFPAEPVWTTDEILNDDFLPE